jgi:thioredoxin 1
MIRLTGKCRTSSFSAADRRLKVQRTKERPMAGQNVKEFTDGNFEEEVLKSSEPVLVDFWAEWCGPCRMLAPTIDKIANEYQGKVKVGKIDTDVNRDVSIKYNISAIPTVILFKDGQVAQKFVGLRQERDFKEAIDKLG